MDRKIGQVDNLKIIQMADAPAAWFLVYSSGPSGRDLSSVLYEDLGKGPETYGMIHSDMYPENVLFKAGEAYPIDFEDCGFGYWLWDMAMQYATMVLWASVFIKNDPARRAEHEAWRERDGAKLLRYLR